MRVGIGFDVHGFEEGNELFLGGVNIPHEKSLAGHSDADVLLHAICDAMLGALALGDIGKYFPPTDSRYRGISSMILLEEVAKLAGEKGYRAGNLDAVVIADEPRISPYVEEMRKNIAVVLGITPEQVSVKGTTTEGLGFTGRKEGIAAQAVALMVKTAS